mgnify:CR=1 FL=1
MDKDFFLFICYFITCKQPCELEFTGFMIKQCFDKNHCRQTIACVLFTPYIRICLLMRNLGAVLNMKREILALPQIAIIPHLRAL